MYLRLAVVGEQGSDDAKYIGFCSYGLVLASVHLVIPGVCHLGVSVWSLPLVSLSSSGLLIGLWPWLEPSDCAVFRESWTLLTC